MESVEFDEHNKTTTCIQLTTAELKKGDLVLHYGMHVRLRHLDYTRPCRRCEDPTACRHGATLTWVGVVENADTLNDAWTLGRAHDVRRTRQACQERAYGTAPLWVVQGNNLATWTVQIDL